MSCLHGTMEWKGKKEKLCFWLEWLLKQGSRNTEVVELLVSWSLTKGCSLLARPDKLQTSNRMFKLTTLSTAICYIWLGHYKGSWSDSLNTAHYHYTNLTNIQIPTFLLLILLSLAVPLLCCLGTFPPTACNNTMMCNNLHVLLGCFLIVISTGANQWVRLVWPTPLTSTGSKKNMRPNNKQDHTVTGELDQRAVLVCTV